MNNSEIKINVKESNVSNRILNLYFGITAAVILILDQLTKYLVNGLPDESLPISIIPDLIYISRITNTGAAFGLFQGRINIFIIISIIAVILIIFLKIRLNIHSILYNIALGFILGGALGNLVDRIFRREVTDFIHFRFFAVFNVADSFINIGFVIIVIIIIRSFVIKDKDKKSE
jgi:signal peptidase II